MFIITKKRLKRRMSKKKRVLEVRKEEELMIYMTKDKEVWDMQSDIIEKEGYLQLKEPSPLTETVMNFAAVESTKEVNFRTYEEPKMVKIGTKMGMDE